MGASGETNVGLHLKPKGTGETIIGTGGAAATLTTSGAYDLILDTNSGSNSGTIQITDAADGDITLTPNGTGDVVLSADTTQAGTIKITEDTANILEYARYIYNKNSQFEKFVYFSTDEVFGPAPKDVKYKERDR